MSFDEFLDKFDSARPAGTGFNVNCPAHEDREASLSVSEGDDGRVLLQCRAGCPTTSVVEAMGLSMADLFARPRDDQKPDAVYSYHDERGEVLFEALRYGTGAHKRFKQRHYDPEHPDARNDGYVYNLDGVRRVPYRLPGLLAAIREGKTVYVVEGEKDADRITAETGRFATCNPMGAGKWRDEYTQHFIGAKQVIVIQDNDDPGRRHAAKVAEAMKSIGVPVLIFKAKVGKDISDHLDAGLKMEELDRPRATPRRGIVTSRQMSETFEEYLQYRDSDLPVWQLVPGVEASGVRPGRLYVIGAYTGDGKTTYALQGARALSQLGVKVGYFSMEMSEKDLMNRLVAHQGVPMQLLERPTLLRANQGMYERARAASTEISEWPLDIVYETNLKIDTVVEYTKDREYEFIVIDHIHRLGFGDRHHLEDQIKSLTNLALDANVPVLILAQLRKFARGKDMLSYPAPVLQDFRETSTLGDEASIAVALWRQRDQEGLRYIGTQTQFRILKNRHTTGRKDQAGHIELLDFNPVTQLFTPGGITSAADPEDESWQDRGGEQLDVESDEWG